MIPSPSAPQPGLPAGFRTAGTSSFSAFLAGVAPELLPDGRPGTDRAPAADRRPGTGPMPGVPHGTTIVAASHATGVVMTGDRRATMGNYIAQNDMTKVFPADDYSCVGIAGSAGLALELVRLFQVELEHYEKIEGALLSLDGKANRLAQMLRGNLGMAMQGLAVVPLFAGYDLDAEDPATAGRIFSYDVTGGRYEEHAFHCVGSGSVFARGSLKKTFHPGMDEADCVLACVQALYDAADEDSATGGPDLTRRIFPVVVSVTASGYRQYSDDEAGAVAEDVVAQRMRRPGGPEAPLR